MQLGDCGAQSEHCEFGVKLEPLVFQQQACVASVKRDVALVVIAGAANPCQFDCIGSLAR